MSQAQAGGFSCKSFIFEAKTVSVQRYFIKSCIFKYVLKFFVDSSQAEKRHFWQFLLHKQADVSTKLFLLLNNNKHWLIILSLDVFICGFIICFSK